jgi:Rps23 Pro-64 3,4-dihydroxylase Tpa1-like proline 4-hydroxylase
MFASYYFKGDYLLCHDDVIEDRLYAFSYYLEDHDSADLVLLNKDANKEVKRIKVKKNTLAIF